MKVSEIIKLIEADGWVLHCTKGSHRRFRHPPKPGTVTDAGKLIKDVPRVTLNSIRSWSQGGVDRADTLILERGESTWGAHVPDLPGCVAVGDSREEALGLIREAIELHIESLRENGDPVPEPRSEGEVVVVGAA